MLFWIALFGRALEQFSRFRDQNPFREKAEHANAPNMYRLCGDAFLDINLYIPNGFLDFISKHSLAFFLSI